MTEVKQGNLNIERKLIIIIFFLLHFSKTDIFDDT